ncbi:hypothetical protein K438DRAFT_2019835 [Mycena galopus ATCC 62051]|nr:hypothetical protein K438DRAFT_2019835 [Mycena galopus ATCC 62051]
MASLDDPDLESDGEYMSGSEGDRGSEAGSEEDYESEFESKDDCSSFKNGEMPNNSFDAMPEDLVLPPELHRLVLFCENQYHHVWGTAWKEHIEFFANTMFNPNLDRVLTQVPTQS